jgi:hypothetical protein
MTGRARRLVITATLAVITGAIAVAFVHPDWYPQIGTYGVSAGTSTTYCSADFVSGHLQLSCERAS